MTEDLTTLSTEDLLKLKKKYETLRSSLDNEQNARKTSLNALYGALGNKHFMFYHPDLAESITLSGQATIKTAQKHINEFLGKLFKNKKDYVIASDTDSAYVNLAPLVEQMCKGKNDHEITDYLDKAINQIVGPAIAKNYQEFFDRSNGAENSLNMKREMICRKAFWIKKKRYAAHVMDKEGTRYKEPKIKVSGFEVVRSTTPKFIRNAIKEVVELIFVKDEEALIEFVAKFKHEFMTRPVEEISFPKGISDLDKWIEGGNLMKGAPIHVSAAFTYNSMVDKHGIGDLHRKISSGDKMKYVPLRKPNPARSHVLGFIDRIPKEFDIDRYIDREELFDKTFLAPIVNIAHAISWKTEPGSALEDFFT